MATETVVPICYVNGKRYELPEGRAEATLLQWLRGPPLPELLKAATLVLVESIRANEAKNRTAYGVPLLQGSADFRLAAEIHLTGTKLGCAEGGCGACTVMVSHQAESKLVHRSVNACLCPLYAVEGMHVVTVEGNLSVCMKSSCSVQSLHTALCADKSMCILSL